MLAGGELGRLPAPRAPRSRSSSTSGLQSKDGSTAAAPIARCETRPAKMPRAARDSPCPVIAQSEIHEIALPSLHKSISCTLAFCVMPARPSLGMAIVHVSRASFAPTRMCARVQGRSDVGAEAPSCSITLLAPLAGSHSSSFPSTIANVGSILALSSSCTTHPALVLRVCDHAERGGPVCAAAPLCACTNSREIEPNINVAKCTAKCAATCAATCAAYPPNYRFRSFAAGQSPPDSPVTNESFPYSRPSTGIGTQGRNKSNLLSAS